MKTSEVVKLLLNAIEGGTKAEIVEIALRAIDEAVEEARPKRRRRKAADGKPPLRAA